MFGSGHKKKKSGGIFGIFRIFLSLFMMTILGLGAYQAYKAFSGYDPLQVSPSQVVSNLFTSQSFADFVTSLLTLSPETSVKKAKEILGDPKTPDQNISNTSGSNTNSSPLLFKFAVIADSHTDYASLEKALAQAKSMGAKFVIGAGDFSDVGTVDELSKSKQKFDASGLTYYLTAGDHDLWDNRNKKEEPGNNFTQVFGTVPYSAFSYENVRFILLFNADNYVGLDEAQLLWIEEELNKLPSQNPRLTLAFVHIPLFHPSSDHVMGKETPKLKNQAEHLMSIFKRKGVAEVISGDAHFFSRYKEPTNELSMTSAGAVTSIRNPQAPRFVMVDVHEDGSYNISDTEIK
jgi:hypothetical protein